MSAVAKIWRNRLIEGARLFSECPEKYKNDVMELLRQDLENNVISYEWYQHIIES